VEGAKTKNLDLEKPSEQGENQQQTQLTYGPGLEPNPVHIGGRQVLILTTVPSLLLKTSFNKCK